MYDKQCLRKLSPHFRSVSISFRTLFSFYFNVHRKLKNNWCVIRNVICPFFYCNHFLILILFTYVHFSSGLYHLILYNGLNNSSVVYCILSNQLVMKSSDYHPWIYQASPLAFFSTFKLMTLISKTKYFTS
jgi:hypothetical protein